MEISYQVRPIGWVRSPQTDRGDAPRQGDEGAPDAWLVLNPNVGPAARDLAVGSQVIVLTCELEAINNTPIVDLKPVLKPRGQRG